MEITQDELKRFVSYDPTTGIFIRLATANGRKRSLIGKPCGSLNKQLGYMQLSVGGKPHYVHRLAWIYMNGAIPSGARIDHRDLDRTNNRIDNLRLATHADNLRNCKVRRDNTSGVKGVWYDQSRDRWVASVGRKHIDRFRTLEEAAAARKKAATRTFGEFARE